MGPIASNNQKEEEGEKTRSQITISLERRRKKRKKDLPEGNKECPFDKILPFPFVQDKKQAGELDLFFASVYESTKSLPRRLQLRVKADVMKTVINAETECINHKRFTSSASVNS